MNIRQLRRILSFSKPLTPEFYPNINPSWVEYLGHIKNELMIADPTKFLTFPTIQLTMFVGNCEMINTEYNEILRDPQYETKWKKALIEHPFGNPVVSDLDHSTSGNVIHQVYHLMMYEKHTGKDVLDTKYVLEFGGGYGNMAKIFKSLGYTGKYVIFDLDICSIVQRFYLSNIGMEEGKDFECVSELEKLEAMQFDPNSIFIANWSLNESPVALRERFKGIIKSFDKQLISYNYTFDGVDNAVYFKEWQDAFPGSTWHDFMIKTLGHSNYLFK